MDYFVAQSLESIRCQEQGGYLVCVHTVVWTLSVTRCEHRGKVTCAARVREAPREDKRVRVGADAHVGILQSLSPMSMLAAPAMIPLPSQSVRYSVAHLSRKHEPPSVLSRCSTYAGFCEALARR